MDKAYKYKAFKSLGKGGRKPKDYDVKQDGRCKARLVAGGHMTGSNTDAYYSSVVSLRAMRMMIFLAELNGMELIAADISNAYLETYTDEK
eukprot:4974209-Ditylum_brightwellii.AAC.1